MRCQLITGDKQPTNLLKYAKCCQNVYQGLKDLARMKIASKHYTEKCAIAIAKFISQLATSKRNQLMKEKKCFLCKQKPTNK